MRKDGYHKDVYMNFHFYNNLRVEFIVYQSEKMQ